MNADPQVIFKQVKSELEPSSVVFRLADTSQFYITFECWYLVEHEEEEEEEEEEYA
jgi:hypothetical protein